MSTDNTVFRTKIEPTTKPLPVGTEPTRGEEVDVPVPYLDADNFMEDYFELGTQWKDHDAVFSPDIEKIDGYIASKIKSGELANDQKAVKDFIKTMEKTNNLIKESRAVVKLEVLANYCEFLTKNDRLKSNLRRYTQ